MNLKKLTKDDKLEFHGIEIDREYRDSNLYSVTIRFEDGNFFTISKGEYGDLCVLVKSPPKMIKKWRVKGEFYERPFESIFDDKYAAESCKNSLSGDLKVEEFEVSEE